MFFGFLCGCFLGQRVGKLVLATKSTAQAFGGVSLQSLIQQMDDIDRWDDADIVQCLHYVKHSSKLNIAPEFEDFRQ